MLVIVANSLPPAIRGHLKLWFIEAAPNVFISGIKDFVAQKLIEYLRQFCPVESGLVIFQSDQSAPGYKIHTNGLTKRSLRSITGLQLIAEKKMEKDDLSDEPAIK